MHLPWTRRSLSARFV